MRLLDPERSTLAEIGTRLGGRRFSRSPVSPTRYLCVVKTVYGHEIDNLRCRATRRYELGGRWPDGPLPKADPNAASASTDLLLAPDTIVSCANRHGAER